MEKKQVLRYLYNTIIILMLLIGIAVVVLQFCHFGHVEYTDNARVCQHVSPQNVRVQGFIREIRFEAYDYVHKGDTLVVLDDSEMRLRLMQAEADYAKAQAGNRAASAGIRTTGNNLLVNDASIEEALVQLADAEREDKRFATLLSNKAVTQQQYDAVHTRYLSAQARLDQVTRTKTTTSLVRDEQNAHLNQTEATLALMEANIEMARLNLSYCTIIATCDGVVGSKDINVGQLVYPGQTMVQIVDASDIWVEANYKESQLKHIELGSIAEMSVDAVPGVTYKGEVERLSGGTGSVFSLLPIDNATGNFVKVEQRVTVRIRLTETDSEKIGKLRAGYNVECEIKY